MDNNQTLSCLLCEARHPVPEELYPDGSIFVTIRDVTNYMHMEKVCNLWLEDNEADINTTIKVVVTGLTPAMLALVSACQKHGCALIALNYDRESGTYKEQQVLDADDGLYHCTSTTMCGCMI